MVNKTQFLSKPKTFKRWVKRVITRNANPESTLSQQAQGEQQGVFGVPLVVSISYARRTIGYQDTDQNNHEHAAAIPLVVAKCGSYLKNQGLNTEGIFKLSGNPKRVNTLQEIFDSPLDSYGLHHNWEGYTVVDAAALLQRFFLSLPDPVIPTSFYQRFRNVMDNSSDDNTNQRIDTFQTLICQLPTAHQHLLFYILDLLHLFATNASVTRMDVANLAVIFSPGLLDQPLPGQQLTSQDTTSNSVVEFLIQHQPLFTMDLLVKNEALLMDLDEAFVSPNILRRSFSPSSSHTTTTASVSSVKSQRSSISAIPFQHQYHETRSLDSSPCTNFSPPPSVNLRHSKDYNSTQSRFYSIIITQLKDLWYDTMDWITCQINGWWHHAHPPLLLGWYFTLGIIASVTAYEGHLVLDELAIVEPCVFFGGFACFLYLFIHGTITTPTISTQNTSDNNDNKGDCFENYHSSDYSYGADQDDGPKTQHKSKQKQTFDENSCYYKWNKIVD